MAKSKIKGPFEKYNLFEKMNLQDHCWEVDGVKVSGPGVFCWIYIFIIIITSILSLFQINMYKEKGFSNTQIFVRYFFQFLYLFLSATFMYSMCKRCRGLEGLLILMLLGFIASIIALGPFVATVTRDVESLKKVEGMSHEKTCGR
jgi:hypothetical protein